MEKPAHIHIVQEKMWFCFYPYRPHLFVRTYAVLQQQQAAYLKRINTTAAQTTMTMTPKKNITDLTWVHFNSQPSEIVQYVSKHQAQLPPQLLQHVQGTIHIHMNGKAAQPQRVWPPEQGPDFGSDWHIE